MKKVLLFCATIVLAFSLVSCSGGSSKKDRNAAIKAKAEYIVKEAAKASMNEDYDRLQEIAMEEAEYAATLSESELEIYNEAALEAGKRLLD